MLYCFLNMFKFIKKRNYYKGGDFYDYMDEINDNWISNNGELAELNPNLYNLFEVVRFLKKKNLQFKILTNNLRLFINFNGNFIYIPYTEKHHIKIRNMDLSKFNEGLPLMPYYNINKLINIINKHNKNNNKNNNNKHSSELPWYKIYSTKWLVKRLIKQGGGHLLDDLRS